MTPLTLLLAVLLPLFVQQPTVQDKPAAKKQSVTTESITVYYFHTSRRCKTCLGIEDVAKSLVKEQYGSDKAIVFKSLNIEEDKNESLVERFQVAGSSLIVARGAKSEDLTTDAFQYALRDPGKLQRLLINAIEALRKG